MSKSNQKKKAERQQRRHPVCEIRGGGGGANGCLSFRMRILYGTKLSMISDRFSEMQSTETRRRPQLNLDRLFLIGQLALPPTSLLATDGA